mmetsp:Transcript_8000/g.22517  ORF Transcript_8000/g.22517 Transcript_8000/m.22517 type:complete len:301 (-) Transcript_8000:549-1451(-)
MDFKPLRSRMVEHLNFVRAFLRLAVMAHIRDEVILGLRVGGLAVGVDVVPQVEALQGELHNCRVLLNEEVVVAEALDNEDDVRRDPAKAVPPDLAGLATLGDGLERLLAVELLEQVEEGHLGDEVEVVLEERLVGQLERQEEGLLLRLDDACLVRRRAQLHLHLALEDVVDQGAAVPGLELLVEVAHEPAEQRDGVLLLRVKLLGRRLADCLVELVWGHEPLEIPGVVHFPQEVCQCGQHRVRFFFLRRLIGKQEVAERDDLAKALHHNVLIVRVGNVVQADATGDIIRSIQCFCIPNFQ